MTEPLLQSVASAVAAAEQLLETRAGTAVRLAEPEDLGGSGRTAVIRVRVQDNPLSLDRTLVLKVLGSSVPDEAFRRELASYRYATALPATARPGPLLVAADQNEQLMVLSDLGDGRSLTDLLSQGDPSSISQVISAWGQALGRLHASTYGGEADFSTLLNLSSGTGADEPFELFVETSVELASEIISDRFPFDQADQIIEFLTTAAGLLNGGEFRAFSPFDVGPQNILLNDDGVKFLDYEWGGFRDATLDISYALVTFAPATANNPAVDETLLKALARGMFDAWCSEVQHIWPLFSRSGSAARRVVTAQLLWVWLSTIWLLPEQSLASDLPVGAGEKGEIAPAVTLLKNQHSDLGVLTNNPATVVQHWVNLGAAAELAGIAVVAEFARQVAATLEISWLG